MSNTGSRKVTYLARVQNTRQMLYTWAGTVVRMNNSESWTSSFQGSASVLDRTPDYGIRCGSGLGATVCVSIN